MNHKMLEYAFMYLDFGLSIIPVGQNKKPLIEWKEFQKRKPNREEVIVWLETFEDMNIAVVTGEISDIVVVDVEAGGEVSKLPATIISRTGGGGWHYFYKYPGHKIDNAVRINDKTDIRGDGGYAILPPSIHASGKEYEWAVGLDMADFAEFPEELFRRKQPVFASEEKDWDTLMSEVNPEGTRNDKGARVAGKLLNSISEDLWKLVGWSSFLEWNQKQNDPPLDEKELRSIWESICKKHLSDKDSDNQKVFKPIHISELMAKEFRDPEWVVDGLIPSGGITAISGAPSSYKTFIILELASKVANGDVLFSKFETTKKGILIVDEENGERLFHQRFRQLGVSEKLNINIISLDNFKLEDKTVAMLMSICRERDIGVVIFDSLVRIHSGNENDARDMSRVANLLKQITKNGITVIFTHHNRKSSIFRSDPSQDMRGSSDILASVDCHLAVKKKDTTIVVTQTKLRHAKENNPFQLRVNGGNDKVEFEYLGEIDKEKSKVEIIKDSVKDVLENEVRPLNQKQMTELIREGGITVNPGTLRIALGELEGQIYTRPGYRNANYYSLNPISDEELEELIAEAKNAAKTVGE